MPSCLMGWFREVDEVVWSAPQLSVVQQGTKTATATMMSNMKANHFCIVYKDNKRRHAIVLQC